MRKLRVSFYLKLTIFLNRLNYHWSLTPLFWHFNSVVHLCDWLQNLAEHAVFSLYIRLQSLESFLQGVNLVVYIVVSILFRTVMPINKRIGTDFASEHETDDYKPQTFQYLHHDWMSFWLLSGRKHPTANPIYLNYFSDDVSIFLKNRDLIRRFNIRF